MTERATHMPVMASEVLEAIAPKDSDIIVDGTYGAGGYAKAYLDASQCTVYGIDRDGDAIERGRTLERAYSGRLHLIEGRFADMEALLSARGIESVDGIDLDLGISSTQLDDPERGLSFQSDGPLDMRMSRTSDDDPSAAEIIANADEFALADLIWRYGDERKSRSIAKAIVEARSAAPITRTLQLAEIVSRVVGRDKRRKTHPATKTFQALRIYCNDELGQLERGLQAAERLLAPLGRLAVVSFHSLEDRIVKSFLRQRSGSLPRKSRYLPSPPNSRAATFSLHSRSARKPSDTEISRNPRARSARLRAATRTDAPAWPTGAEVLV